MAKATAGAPGWGGGCRQRLFTAIENWEQQSRCTQGCPSPARNTTHTKGLPDHTSQPDHFSPLHSAGHRIPNLLASPIKAAPKGIFTHILLLLALQCLCSPSQNNLESPLMTGSHRIPLQCQGPGPPRVAMATIPCIRTVTVASDRCPCLHPARDAT